MPRELLLPLSLRLLGLLHCFTSSAAIHAAKQRVNKMPAGLAGCVHFAQRVMITCVAMFWDLCPLIHGAMGELPGLLQRALLGKHRGITLAGKSIKKLLSAQNNWGCCN